MINSLRENFLAKNIGLLLLNFNFISATIKAITKILATIVRLFNTFK